MTGKSNRVLAIALALSLLVHAVVALFARYHRVEAAAEPPPTRVTMAHIPKRTPPPPTPTPAPTLPPKDTLSHQPKPVRPTVTSPVITSTAPPKGNDVIALASPGPERSPGPEATGGIEGTAVPQPTASPTPKPQCSTPYEAARTIAAVEPAIPGDFAGTAATVQVQVTLSASGSVTAASVFHSADNFELDHAALNAARASKYAPEVRDCKPVGGTYLFTATFEN